MTEPSVEGLGIRILVLSAPGQCTTRATAAQELFEQELKRVFGSATVEVRPQFFGVSDTRTLDFRPIDSLRKERRRLVALFMSCVLWLVDDAREERRERYELGGNRWTEPEGDDPGRLHGHPVIGVPRTVLGMVATNAPWRTAAQLSSALAAASAAGAFGVFYDSIWQRSAALSTGRLMVIGLLAITLRRLTHGQREMARRPQDEDDR